MFGGDIACLHLALFLTLILRYPRALWAKNWQGHWPNFLIVFGLWLLISYINSLYSLNLKTVSRKFLGAALNTAIVSGLLSILYFYLNPATNIAPKTNLLIFMAIFLIFFLIWRGLYQALVHSFLPQDNLAIIGDNVKTAKLLAGLQNNPGAGYHAALIFKNAAEITALGDTIKAKNIRAIVVCDDFGQSEKLSQILFNCLAYNINFFDYPDFYELLTDKIPVEAIGPDWFLENLREGKKNYFNLVKKYFDFILALFILLVSLVFWPLIAVLIKLTSRGPIFFRQTRLGKQEKPFTIIKFRTMRTNDNNLSPTRSDDERVFGFGSFLRRTRLDEIPQVINILKGEMSFIGPRPERPEIIAELERQIPFYKTRLLIKPGLTGWDQISGHYHSASSEDSLEKLQYDLFYIKQRSFYLDLTIALKTLATMMGQEGR